MRTTEEKAREADRIIREAAANMRRPFGLNDHETVASIKGAAMCEYPTSARRPAVKIRRYKSTARKVVEFLAIVGVWIIVFGFIAWRLHVR